MVMCIFLICLITLLKHLLSNKPPSKIKHPSKKKKSCLREQLTVLILSSLMAKLKVSCEVFQHNGAVFPSSFSFFCIMCMTAHIPAHGFVLLQLLTIGYSCEEWTRRFLVCKHGCKQCWMLQKIYDEENVFSIFVRPQRCIFCIMVRKKDCKHKLVYLQENATGHLFKELQIGLQWMKQSAFRSKVPCRFSCKQTEVMFNDIFQNSSRSKKHVKFIPFLIKNFQSRFFFSFLPCLNPCLLDRSLLLSHICWPISVHYRPL